MSYELYKVLHLTGVFLIVGSLGGFAAVGMTDGATRDAIKKVAGGLHGIGLLLAFVAGFGLIARLGVGFPVWIWVKMAIWFFLGAATIIIRRSASMARAMVVLIPLLAALAAFLGVYKPGG